MTKDFDKRDELGAKPFERILDEIKALNNLKDLEKSFKEMTLNSIETPFGFAVMQDFMNSNNQVLYFGATNLFLPDTSYYKDEKTKAQLIGLFTQTTTNLLSLYGFSSVAIEKLISEALAFDALLVPVTKSSVEAADYVNMYNPFSKSDVIKLTKNFDVISSAEALVKKDVETLIVMNPAFIKAFDSIVNEQNFDLIKSWMIVSNAKSFASNLTDELRIASGAFGRALSGIKEAQSKEKFAFYQAYNAFSQVVGLYYGENYFGPVAKEDVKKMVHEIIAIYNERITNNDWLNEKTKEKAIKKISHVISSCGLPR